MAIGQHTSSDDFQFLTNGRAIIHHCRACGATASARVYARVAAAQQPDGWAEWVSCPGCQSCSAIGLEPPAYEDDQPISASALKYYVEQNAAIDVLANLIAGIHRHGPTRILDVGCGFGFLLDYARSALGWEPQGIDPSTFARAGQSALGLPIAFEYLSNENASRFASDVIVCSEIIEHLTGPDAFLATLKRTLQPGGALVMTTPSSRCAAPGAGLDRNILAYAPGQHIIVYSRQGLEAALLRAGFTSVQVHEAPGGIHLVAAASVDGDHIDLSARVDAASFRRWLGQRADSASDPSLEIGFCGRLLKLAVSAGAWSEARVAEEKITGMFAKLGIDLSRPDDLDPPEADSFVAYALLAPCNIASVLFHLGRIAEQDDDLVLAEARFRAAVRFGTALNNRLREVPALDLETAGQVEAATARAAAFRAGRDPAGSARELAALGEAAFGPDGCPPHTFLHVVGRAISRELDITPLEAACCPAIAKAPGYAPGQLWLSMALAAFKNGDTALALRALERIPGGGDGLDADRRRLTDEAYKRLLLAALAEGRLDDAARARDRLSAEGSRADDLAEALGLVALNHDREPLVAAELFGRSAHSGRLQQVALSWAFLSAVACGRLEEARGLRLRLDGESLSASSLQLALGLMALNGDGDPETALKYFEASNEPEASSLRHLARRRVFTNLCLEGNFVQAMPMGNTVRADLETAVGSHDPDLGRAWAALALLASSEGGAARDAQRYASQAMKFDLDRDLLELLNQKLPNAK